MLKQIVCLKNTLRKKKSTKERIKYILALVLSLVVLFGLLYTTQYSEAPFIDSQSVTTIDEIQNYGLPKEVKFASSYSNMRLKTP